MLGFAGPYAFWPDPVAATCMVLTTTTQDALGHVHDRSPVVIPKDMFNDWLNPDLPGMTAAVVRGSARMPHRSTLRSTQARSMADFRA